MSLLTILIVAAAIAVGTIFMLMLATLLAAGIFVLVPHLQHTWAALSIWVLAKHAAGAAARSIADAEQEPDKPVLVVLCKQPLDPEYLVGLAGRRPVFTRDKKSAKRLEHGDLAVRAWMRSLEERYDVKQVFVCYAEKGGQQ